MDSAENQPVTCDQLKLPGLRDGQHGHGLKQI